MKSGGKETKARDAWSEVLHNLGTLFLTKLFRNCDSSKGKRLIDCNKPQQEKKYTVLFQDTNPSPYGLEFLPGETYFYICESNNNILTTYYNTPITT